MVDESAYTWLEMARMPCRWQFCEDLAVRTPPSAPPTVISESKKTVSSLRVAVSTQARLQGTEVTD